jgi:hypothetical protein
MYGFEKKYVSSFQEQEKLYISFVENAWLEVKNNLEEECKKFFENGYIGFEIFTNFFLSTENMLPKLKDWHRQVHDMKLAGGGMLTLIHSSLVIIFREGIIKIQEAKTVPILQNLPYYQKDVEFVLGTKFSFLENYIEKNDRAKTSAIRHIKNFIEDENLEKNILSMLLQGNTGVEIFDHPLLYRAIINYNPIEGSKPLPEYLKIVVIQTKVVISLSDEYISKIKEKKMALEIYNTLQTSIIVKEKLKIPEIFEEEIFEKNSILKLYMKGYQYRLATLVKNLKKIKIDSGENIKKLEECAAVGKLGFSIYKDDYILATPFKKVLDEIIISLPRNLILFTSATGELILKYNISDKILIENNCYGSYRNSKLFYTDIS